MCENLSGTNKGTSKHNHSKGSRKTIRKQNSASRNEATPKTDPSSINMCFAHGIVQYCECAYKSRIPENPSFPSQRMDQQLGSISVSVSPHFSPAITNFGRCNHLFAITCRKTGSETIDSRYEFSRFDQYFRSSRFK